MSLQFNFQQNIVLNWRKFYHFWFDSSTANSRYLMMCLYINHVHEAAVQRSYNTIIQFSIKIFSHEFLLWVFLFFLKKIWEHRKKVRRQRRSCGKKTDDCFEPLTGQLWHMRCSFSAHMLLFLGLHAKKTSGKTVDSHHASLHLSFRYCNGIMWRPYGMALGWYRNTCCLNVWDIVMSWTMTEGGTLSLPVQMNLETPTEL